MFFKLANLIMGGTKFLGADATIEEGANSVSTFVVDTINSILTPILSIVGAAGLIWAIVLGVQMARADSTEKREECKKRLIGLVVGIVIMVALILFFNFGLEALIGLFQKPAA